MSTSYPGEQEVRDWLMKRGVRFLAKVYEFPLELIDEKTSRSNQARPTALEPEAVERYTIARKEGKMFPPGVAYFPLGGTKDMGVLYKEKAKVVLIDGNNRQAAFKKAGDTTFPLLIVAADTPSELIQLLTVEANTSHGQSVSKEWRTRQAVHLKSIGFSPEEAASAAGVSVVTLRNKEAVVLSDVRARTLNIRKYSELPQVVKLELSKIRDDEPFAALARIVISTDMSTDEVKKSSKEIRGLTSEGLRFQFLRHLQESRRLEAQQKAALGKKARKVMSPKTNLITALGKLNAVDPPTIAKGVIQKIERDELLKRLEAAAEKVLELQVELEALQFN